MDSKHTPKLNSFIIHEPQFASLIEDATPDEAGQIFLALGKYALYGIEPEIPNNRWVRTVFNTFRTQLDIDKGRFAEFRKKQIENGKLGGAPKGNQNARKKSGNNPNNPSVDLDNNRNNNDVEAEIITNENNPNNPLVEKTTQTTHKGKGERVKDKGVKIEIDKDKEKEKKKNLPSSTQEINEIDFFNKLMTDDEVLQANAELNGIDKMKVLQMAQMFQTRIKATGKKHYDYEAYRSHFTNWLTKYLQEAKKGMSNDEIFVQSKIKQWNELIKTHNLPKDEIERIKNKYKNIYVPGQKITFQDRDKFDAIDCEIQTLVTMSELAKEDDSKTKDTEN